MNIKSLILVFVLLLMGDKSLAQNVYIWPNSPWNPPVQAGVVSNVSTYQPVVVQTVTPVLLVETRIIYQPSYVPGMVYQPGIWNNVQTVGVWPYYHRCRLFNY